MNNELKQQIINDFKDIINFSRCVSNKLKNYDVSQLEIYLKQHPEFESIRNLIRCICLNIKLPNCKYCGKPISYSRRKRIYCNGFCAHNDPNVKSKIKNTFDKNFRQNPNNMNNLKNRIKNTQMEKYGGIGFQSSILMEKVKETNIKKYGVENVFSSKEIQQKIKETNIKKYGVEYPIQCENIKKKCKENNLKKYGTEIPFQSDCVKEKIKNTIQQKYGVEWPMQSDIIKQHLKNNSIKKYGHKSFHTNEAWNTILKFSDKVVPLFDKSKFNGLNQKYKWKCVKCGNEFETIYGITTFIDKDFERLPRCLNCYPYLYGYSNLEKELVDFCKQYFPNLKENNRQLIKPLELDIVIEELKLCLEFNGNFYHSVQKDFGVPLGYHLNKTIECNEKGYRLIHIWEDEWNSNKDLIKQKLIDIFECKEIIDYNQKLDRSWYNNLEGDFEELPPEIIIRDGFEVENCGYLVYIKNKNDQI